MEDKSMWLTFLAHPVYKKERQVVTRKTWMVEQGWLEGQRAAHLAEAIENSLVAFREVPLRDEVEYTQHRVLIKLVDRDDLKVSHEPCW